LARTGVLRGPALRVVERYDTHRPHRSLEQRPPDHAEIPASSSTSQFDRIQQRTVVGGLINEYERAA
jgi:putative transposase